MNGRAKNHSQKRIINYRSPKPRFEKSYLFDRQIRMSRRIDKELNLVCQQVIELECHYRIHGHLSQDPVAILSAARVHLSTSNTLHHFIEDCDQFYDRIEVIDETEELR